jgi:hypothetical protein
VVLSAGSTVVFELADVSRTELRVEVEELDAARLLVESPVVVRAPGQETALGKGRIARVSSRLERRTIDADDARVRADGQVRASWLEWSEPPTPPLPVGQRVDCVINLPERQAASVVPRRAVRVKNGQATVSVPWGPIALDRRVELGAADDERVEVRGISPGTTVLMD